MPDYKKIAFGLDSLKSCIGYQPKFINDKTKVGLDNILSETQQKLMPAVDGNKKNILHYCDFSILYHKKRKLPFVVAYNIDGSTKANQPPRPVFRADPRIDAEIQLDKPFYDLEKRFTEFEIGHMASNNEMGRGTNSIVKAYQTFHFTNSAPQAEVLNTGLWKGLESYIVKEAGAVTNNKKVCVFTGPVLDPKDPPYVHDEKFKVPLLFFKVVVFAHAKGLYATAFIISHEKRLIEHELIPAPKVRRRIRRGEPAFTSYPYKEVFQVNIPFVEKITGLNFSWKGVKPLEVPDQSESLTVIKSIENAAEAKKRIRRGEPNVVTTVETKEISEKEARQGNFTVNIILPQ